MSGIVAILNRDGSPIDPSLLRRLTNFLVFRGPDAQRIWCDGAVGLGHTLLRTTPEAEHECQPISLDGGAWIVADARVDAREELLDALAQDASSSLSLSPDATDAELILRAYLAWGENCLERLLGDFAFVIWDARRRRFFAARDHFGVKPLFYAETAHTLLISNTLKCLRLHPQVSMRFNERYIGDILLMNISMDPAITVFSEIARLPAAHALVGAFGEGLRIHRYWTLPIEVPLRYRYASEYVDQFRELLRTAVRDRLRTGRISVTMSGGLDSPSVAATACALTGSGAVPGAVRAFTIACDGIIPDRERHFSGVVARHLGFPIRYVACEDYRLFEGFEEISTTYAEPPDDPLAHMNRECLKLAAMHSRVLLTGEGGDPGLAPSLSFYRGWRFPSLVVGVARHLISHGKMPRIGFRIAFNRWRGGYRSEPTRYPGWLQPGFEARVGLRDRWRELHQEPQGGHPDRPAAYHSLSGPFWSSFLSYYEPKRLVEGTIEARHPLLDLRLIRFLLRLPTLPWCADKELTRVALRGSLPEEIVRRPKALLAGDPIKEMLKYPESSWIDEFEPTPQLREYVVRDRVPALTGPSATGNHDPDLMPLCLNYWLRHSDHLG